MAVIEDMVADFFRKIAKLGETKKLNPQDAELLKQLGIGGNGPSGPSGPRGPSGPGRDAPGPSGPSGPGYRRAQLGRDIFAESQQRVDPRGFEQSVDLVYDPGPYSARAGTTLDMPWRQKPEFQSFRVGAGVPDVPFIGGQLGATAGGRFGSGFQEGQLQYTKPLDELDRDLEQLFRAREQAQRGDTEKRSMLDQLGKAAMLGRN